jgi:lysophospholipase L1-like esterase
LNRLTARSLFHFVLAAACPVVVGCAHTATAPTPPDPGAPVLACPNSITQVSMLAVPLAITYDLPTVTGGFSPVATPTCSPPPGSTFGQGTTSVTCTATDAKQRAGTCAFSVTITYPPKLTVTRFIAFGDSITWGENGQNSLTTAAGEAAWRTLVRFPFADTYPGALQIDLVGRYSLQSPTVVNDGTPGESLLDPTNPALKRFRADLAPGTSRWDAVLILEGSNDLNNRDTRIEPAMIGQLGAMIDFALGAGMKPFLATLPPMNPSGCCPIPRGRGADLVPGFNDQVRTLAMSKSVPLVDVYQAFNGNLALIGPDGLHPTADGYHLVAQTFFTSIEHTLEAAPTSTSTATGRAPATSKTTTRKGAVGRP